MTLQQKSGKQRKEKMENDEKMKSKRKGEGELELNCVELISIAAVL